MTRGLLLGVNHYKQDTLEEVIRTIETLHPLNVGLELPQDYKDRAEIGIVDGFFHEIATRLQKQSIQVVPLDDDGLHDFSQSVDLAMNVVKNNIQRNDIERSLSELVIGPYSSPERAQVFDHFRTIYGDALKVLDQFNYSRDAINALRESTARKRESNMKSIITATRPEVNAVGDGHARRMRYRLIFRYAYHQLV